jgi:hypothetical protein
MKTIHYKDSRVAAAVFEVTLWRCHYTPDEVEAIFRAHFSRSWGRNMTPYGVHAGHEEGTHITRFHVLKANRRQVTMVDIERRLTELGWEVDVRMLAGVPEVGEADNPGSPRQGMPWKRRNSSGDRSIAAR